MSMDAYELHLLGLAQEECRKADVCLMTGDLDGDGSFYAGTINYEGDRNGWFKPTAAEALAALLTGLGVEVPERPSAERLREVACDLNASNGYQGDENNLDGEGLRDLYAREPLTVLTLLEGDSNGSL